MLSRGSAMSLDARTRHPSSRSYVLKLHRDASGQPDRLAGRLENISTGRWFEFANGAELLAGLADDLAAGPAAAVDDASPSA